MKTIIRQWNARQKFFVNEKWQVAVIRKAGGKQESVVRFHPPVGLTPVKYIVRPGAKLGNIRAVNTFVHELWMPLVQRQTQPIPSLARITHVAD